MNEESFKLAVQNPALIGAFTLLALGYVLKLIFGIQRGRREKTNEVAVIENLIAQTRLLESLVRSSERQESSLGNMTTNLVLAMDRQKATSKHVESVREALPGVCHFRKAEQ